MTKKGARDDTDRAFRMLLNVKLRGWELAREGM